MSQTSFKPAWWLRNSHLQTLWPALVRKRQLNPGIQLERERLELPDGDFLDIDWVNRHEQGAIVILLHGFEGSIQSHYSMGMINALHQQGYRSVFMHFRGCSGEHNRLQRGYHSGDTSDLAYLVNELERREPNVALAAIGYSLGGNILLKWLGETGWRNPLKAAVAISVPFDLSQSAVRMQSGFSRFYQWYLLRCLRNRLLQKHTQVPLPVEVEKLNRVTNMVEFDDVFTAPVYGFQDATDYYAESSCLPYLRFIQVPTLILHAKDDPFMTEEVIPEPQALSPSVTMELCDHGGHVGFVAGLVPWRPQYWLESRSPDFLQKFL